MTIYEQAQKLVAAGISVIPIPHKSKRVVIKWAEFQKKLPTESQLADWFKNKQSNIGVVTGALSGLTVVDCDSQDAVRLAKNKGLPITQAVKTGRGVHFYFKYAQGSRNFQACKSLPGIDLRSEGGYVVAPGSIHPNGTEYRWANKISVLAELPKWALSPPEPKPGIQAPSDRMPPLTQRIKRASAYLAKVSASIAGEGGHQDAWSAALKIVKGFALPEEVALDLLLVEFNPRCRPGWTTKELRHKVSDSMLSPLESGFLLDLRGNRGDGSRASSKKERERGEIVSISSLEGETKHVYKNGVDLGVSTGWRNLDIYYTVRKGEMTIVTGSPGSGKTTWLDAMLINIARDKGWKMALFSAENLPFHRHVATLAEQYTGMPFRKGPSERMSPTHLTAALEFLNDHFKFISPHENDCTVPSILNLFRQIKDEIGLDAAVIDPWNEIDHTRPSWCTETEHISQKLTEIRRFARDKNIHIWVVAHPNKPKRDSNGKYPTVTPYDISGGAHWRNKADNCITVCRNFKDESREVEILIQKIRYREIGRIGSQELYFNTRNCRYYESEYELRNA